MSADASTILEEAQPDASTPELTIVMPCLNEAERVEICIRKALRFLYSGMATLLGFQAVVFAVFTKVFAISEGLLPQDRRLARVLDYLTLEGGLIVGSILFVTGLALSLYAVGGGGKRRFGSFDSSRTLRLIVPAFVSLTLVCPIVLSSFFLSVLRLRRR